MIYDIWIKKVKITQKSWYGTHSKPYFCKRVFYSKGTKRKMVVAEIKRVKGRSSGYQANIFLKMEKNNRHSYVNFFINEPSEELAILKVQIKLIEFGWDEEKVMKMEI